MSDSDLLSGLLPDYENMDVDPPLLNSKSPSLYNMEIESPGNDNFLADNMDQDDQALHQDLHQDHIQQQDLTDRHHPDTTPKSDPQLDLNSLSDQKDQHFNPQGPDSFADSASYMDSNNHLPDNLQMPDPQQPPDTAMSNGSDLNGPTSASLPESSAPAAESEQQSPKPASGPDSANPPASGAGLFSENVSDSANMFESANGSDSDSGSAMPPSTATENGSAPKVKIESSTVVETADDDAEDRKAAEIDVDADDKTRVRQSHAIIIPSYASWFNMKKIHQIERDLLPEFFDTAHPSKSPLIYANYRNFMVNAYRLNPNEYLTLTSCRRALVGDVGTLMRVHRFLNRWGLINYQVNPQFKPAYALEKLPDGTSVGLPYSGDYHVQYDTPRGLFPFNTFKPSPSNVNVDKLKELVNGTGVKTEAGAKNQEPTEITYPDSQDADVSGPPTKKLKDDWSPQELANLLLGVKEHRNDWYMIAKQVGNNRSPQDCILKFLKMPIEDRFNQLSDDDLGIMKFAPNFPVITADNPVISNLIFMTNLVDAEVVKAACQKASSVIDEKFYETLEKVYAAKKETEVKTEKEKDDGAEEEEKKDEDPEVVDHEDKPAVDETLKQEFSSEEHPSSNDYLKSAATGVLGAVGARSHLFANYEEREMQRLTSSILNQELNKVDAKIRKVEELEKIYQRERQNLARQQSEVFVDRLALTNTTITVSRKLLKAMTLLKAKNDEKAADDASGDDVAQILEEVQSILINRAKHSLKDVEKEDTSSESVENEPAEKLDANDSKPLSVAAPQMFKVWAP